MRVSKYTHYPLIKGFSCLHFHFSYHPYSTNSLSGWNTNIHSIYYIHVTYFSDSDRCQYVLFFYFLCLFQSNFVLLKFHFFLPYHPFFFFTVTEDRFKRFSIRRHHHHLIFSLVWYVFSCVLRLVCFQIFLLFILSHTSKYI